MRKSDRSLVAPLHKAVADANGECVRILLEAGSLPLASDVNVAQPPHNIRFTPRKRFDTIKALVNYPSDVMGTIIISARRYIGAWPFLPQKLPKTFDFSSKMEPVLTLWTR